jgi:outer membrane receptor protein involved in Fe transport
VAVRAPDAELASVPPRSNEPNAVAPLAGKAPGLTVATPSGRNAGSHVVIRCGGATSRANPPLFIVDGVRLRGGQGEATHPEDIVAVSIVKGAAAVARYGTEARYGAVLIETRRRPTAAERNPT